MNGIKNGKLAHACLQVPDLTALGAVLAQPSLNFTQASHCLRSTLDGCSAESHALLASHIMSPTEIKEHWALKAQMASHAGTWAHLQCECVLNGGAIKGTCAEMDLLRTFVGRTRPLLAFRTEWCIWASDERLAGCIDFAAIDEKGHLVCLGFNEIFMQSVPQ
jgi:hypothetical protein